tara:strand:- start:630 stop:1190 length:561 start_codon:yes stop_codon:yes gene_type:complete
MFWFKKLSVSFFILLSFFLNNAFANSETLNSLKEGNKIVFIRHALAPGNGDPDNFAINDCSTQRNLSKKGIEQSKKIGSFFRKNKIKIDAVLSSEWCRCKDTAFHAFDNFITFDALNSFYDPKLSKNEKLQIANLKKLIESWKSDKNLILITHFVVISSLLKTGSSSGEIIVVNKDLEIQARMETF